MYTEVHCGVVARGHNIRPNISTLLGEASVCSGLVALLLPGSERLGQRVNSNCLWCCNRHASRCVLRR